MKILASNLAAAFVTPLPAIRSRDNHDVRETSSTRTEPSRGRAIKDTLQISPEAEQALAAETSESSDPAAATKPAANDKEQAASSDGAPKTVDQLSDEEQAVVDELRTTDRKVRAHEQAHLAAAGPYAKGGPTYDYQEGPDGQQYAVGGQVQIDTAPVSGDPEATIAKAQVVRAAALAPAEPSAQDRAVAASATKMEIQARQELREKQQQEANGEDEDPSTDLLNLVEEATSGILLDLIA